MRPPAHATRISPEQRRQLADRIAAAQAARDAHATAAGPPPSLPPPDHPELTREQLDALKTPILQALRETVPLLQACFQQAAPDGGGPAFQIRGELTLTGDADIGTLVDAGQLTDDRERPLPAALDDCLRNELQHIELPPLREGDKARVIYVFSDDK